MGGIGARKVGLGNVAGFPSIAAKAKAGEETPDGLERIATSVGATLSTRCEAMANLAECYHRGHGVARDDAKAAQWWRKAVTAGEAPTAATRNEGRSAEKTTEKIKEEPSRTAIIDARVRATVARSAHALGCLCLAGGGAAEKASAAAHGGEDRGGEASASALWFRRAAALGHAEAQNNLGTMASLGTGGVEKDLGEAERLWRLAAGQGAVDAMMNLGRLYLEGDPSRMQAEDVVAVAPSSASSPPPPPPCSSLSSASFSSSSSEKRGGTFERNPHVAFRWFRKAAERGDAEGQYVVGRMHEERRPGADDAGEVVSGGGGGECENLNLSGDAHAVQWYAKAGDQGHADALYRLGCMYIDDGRGVRELAASLGMAHQVTDDQLHLQALAAFMLAGSQGHEAAQEVVHRLRPATAGGEAVDIPTLRRQQHGAAAAAPAAGAAAAATGGSSAFSTSPFSQGADASAAATLSIAQVTLALAQAAEAAAAEAGSSTCDEGGEGGGRSLAEDNLTGQQREEIESKAAATTTTTTKTANRSKKKKGGKQRKK